MNAWTRGMLLCPFICLCWDICPRSGPSKSCSSEQCASPLSTSLFVFIICVVLHNRDIKTRNFAALEVFQWHPLLYSVRAPCALAFWLAPSWGTQCEKHATWTPHSSPWRHSTTTAWWIGFSLLLSIIILYGCQTVHLSHTVLPAQEVRGSFNSS